MSCRYISVSIYIYIIHNTVYTYYIIYYHIVSIMYNVYNLYTLCTQYVYSIETQSKGPEGLELAIWSRSQLQEGALVASSVQVVWSAEDAHESVMILEPSLSFHLMRSNHQIDIVLSAELRGDIWAKHENTSALSVGWTISSSTSGI